MQDATYIINQDAEETAEQRSVSVIPSEARNPFPRPLPAARRRRHCRKAMTGARVLRLRCAPLRTTRGTVFCHSERSEESVTPVPSLPPAGGVIVPDNDRRTDPSTPLRSAQDDRTERAAPPSSALNVLYCDRELLVCEKPVDCLSEPGPGRNLPDLAAAWLREHGEDPAVRTVHRLDKAVGGLTVLARTQAAAASLIGQIAAHSAEKEYLAVLRGVPEADEAVLEDLLFHDSRCNKTFVVTRPRKGVREAKLSYRVQGRAGTPDQPLSLVRVKLYTGRTHQIRAQFSHRGLPLLGDIRYGSKAAHGPALFSCYLAFDHPVTGQRMKYELLPTGEPWNLFAEPQQPAP